MEQTKALNALEPFLALSSSATSARAAADLVTRSTSAPNTYLFAELLQTPQIQSLGTTTSSTTDSESDYSSHLTLLKIFSYGTYESYISTPGLPPLNDEQTLKLRQLSLLSLARNRENLTYAALQQKLGLESARQVEDLVISTFYAGLLNGTLDPSRQTVQVTGLAPLRDLPPGSVPDMTATLKVWADRCSSTLNDLEDQMAAIRAKAAARETEKKASAAKMQALVTDAKEVDKKRAPTGAGAAAGGAGATPLEESSYPRRFLTNKRTMPEDGSKSNEESMDLDEPLSTEADQKRASKRKM